MEEDYLTKTTCDWLCRYHTAFVKLLGPLVVDVTPGRGSVLLWVYCAKAAESQVSRFGLWRDRLVRVQGTT